LSWGDEAVAIVIEIIRRVGEMLADLPWYRGA
jgi:hypothetical protein